jgi:ubiquinone/menaquinone biosynthesis C-methylase UbiE
MIAKIFLALCQIPTFRRIAWKPIYEYLAKKYRLEDWHFMNYGYEPLDGSHLELKPEDEPERYAAQLYHYLALEGNVKGKDMLEVGSGRGGGASHIKRYLEPKTMVGLDLAQNAVDFANEVHHVEGLKYVQGNAEKLPFPDNSFDVAINVESCHAYGSVDIFFNEIKRVLRPGGIFLCTDIRLNEKMDMLEQQLVKSKMTMVSKKDIAPNVVKAIELDSDRKEKRIVTDIDENFAKAFSEFAGIAGSKIHTDLMSGIRSYKWFVMKND